MRLTATLLGSVFLLATGASFFDSGASRVQASTIQANNTPKILNASVNGKKLIVTGENFEDGAVIMVDGKRQKTKNDSEYPSTMLIAKKAGKKIPDNTAVSIQIESAGGLSDKFPFFKGKVITIDDAGKPIILRVGERFLLFLQKAGYEWDPSVLDTSVLRKVDDVIVSGSQGVFEALRVGSTKLAVTGELPCHKTQPACLAPALAVEFEIQVVE